METLLTFLGQNLLNELEFNYAQAKSFDVMD